jgi:4-hydroxyproline epimerase
MSSTIPFVDSHTAGEPTRMIVSGGPDLGSGPLTERLRLLAERHDHFRSAVVMEPRGSDVMVGALLVEPTDAQCTAGVIFFNNVGYLGMCGHGTIGVVASLAHLGRIRPGRHQIETPVGTVGATLHPSGKVTVDNVPSYRFRRDVSVNVPGFGVAKGDIAWGGNWFFITESKPCALTLDNCDALTEFTWALRRALEAAGISGDGGGLIDHIEISAPAQSLEADSRNFVLCPGKAYDRSPCGTGTSAKMACLFADGKLAPGELWRQEGILGTIFEGSYKVADESPTHILPSITGSAFIISEGRLILDPADPFRTGIGS